MIRALILILVLCLPGSAWARPVAVSSGEHAGFTRLVLDFGAPVDWQFGRTEDGYEFRTSGAAVDYDLQSVFKLIGQSRLAAISAVPGSSALDIGFACACHAIPFEFRPGIIVIDLRDGPPPKGSSFEDPLPNRAAPVVPAGPGYDWTASIVDQIAHPAAPKADFAPKPTVDPALQPLRDQLLRQLSRGAAEGVVDLELPKKEKPPEAKPGIDSARVGLGEMPGVQIEATAKEAESLGEVGAVCATDQDLNIDAWGTDAPIAGQFANAFTGLLGEFDRADPQAVAKGVRFLLYIGFGLEARQMVATLSPDAPDAAMLTSLGAIMDGNSDPKGFFTGQAACDTPAALFALLAMDRVTPGDKVNDKAVILAFSNLPAHLRRLLGPVLVQKFLDHQDAASAESIRNAILRAGGETGADVAVAEAKIEMSQGDPQAAQQHLEAAVQDGGAQPDALIELVASLVAQGLPIDRKIAQDLAALQSQVAGTPRAADLDHALILAQASSGDFATAFPQMNPARDGKIWDILASLGTDSDVLAWAVQPDIPADLPLETAGALAGRLQGMGLPDAGFAWVQAYPDIDPAVRAKIHLDRNDGRAALDAAGQVAGEDGARLAAAAQLLLGDHGAAAVEFAKLNDATAQQFAYAKAGQWQDLRAMAPNSWTPVLAALAPATATPAGPLAAGQDLLTSSAKTRAALTDLLASIPKTP